MAGLAIEHGGERPCFLLEKLFLKVKVPSENNTSAVPCHWQFVARDDNDRPEFLAFAQHVQYFKRIKTKKQGSFKVLVDG